VRLGKRREIKGEREEEGKDKCNSIIKGSSPDKYFEFDFATSCFLIEVKSASNT
jgi:hypothetical protein